MCFWVRFGYWLPDENAWCLVGAAAGKKAGEREKARFVVRIVVLCKKTEKLEKFPEKENRKCEISANLSLILTSK